MSAYVAMHIQVFILTFLCMVSRHACLEGWYVMKPEIEKEVEGVDSTILGAIDTIYLFFYAIGLYISGSLEDRFSMKNVISIGMILASFVYFLLVVASWYGLASVPFIIVCWGLQGLLQSTVWPGTVALIANWFPKASHGGWMGVWSCNSGLGNIVGSQIGLLIFSWYRSWELVLGFMSGFMLVCALLTIGLVQDRPEGKTQEERKGSIGFWEAWKLPGVAAYSVAYGCIKLLMYSLMMWLPYYLKNYVQISILQMAIILSIFDVGGFLGSMVAGYISDKTTSREPVLITMMMLAIPVIFCFIFGSPGNVWIYYILVPVCGAFIVACSNLVSTCVATDLAHHTEINEHTNAMATVTGIVDGTGSLGAASGQIVIGVLSKISWNYVFFGMIFVGLVSIFVISIAKFEAESRKNSLNEKLMVSS